MPYKNRSDKYIQQEKHRQRNKKLLWDFLTGKKCIDCGFDDLRALEFDHVRGEKKFDISKAISGSTRSWKTILNEINKCDIRCANCHRIKTQIDRNFWRFLAPVA